MSRLLVSVRDPAEAEAALAGGADLIDVKEPANGPLGRADPPIVDAVIRTVSGRAPISAACGELELHPPPLPDGLAFVKFGLAGWRDRDWAGAWEATRGRLPSGCAAVAVAYADWQRCAAPSPEQVAAVAVAESFGAVLIDTFEKNGRTLLDLLPIDVITAVTRQCQSAGIPVALAGSLGVAEFERLRSVRPDWFAVRGAACPRGRGSSIDVSRVRQLKSELEPQREN